MGARAFMRRRMARSSPSALSYDYVGRELRASPGEGYSAAHKREQERIVRVALDFEEDRLEPDSSGVSGRRCRPGHAAVDHVQHLARPVAAQQAGRRRGALAGAADDGDRPLRVDAVGHAVDVVVGHVDRAGDVARVPLVPLAHVEDLQLVAALVQLVDRDALDPLDRPPLLAPAGHAAVQEAGRACGCPTDSASAAA